MRLLTKAAALGAVLGALFLGGSLTAAPKQNPQVNLAPGKTLAVCAGSLSASRQDADSFLLNCKAPTPSPTPSPSPTPGSYPLHTNIVSTTFWVGEEYKPNASDGSQACSTYDADWAKHWSGGIDLFPEQNAGCTGSPVGGCDGIAQGTTAATFSCNTEPRTAQNGYFPSQAHPAENPFYLDLPYDDLNNAAAFKDRCSVVPWAKSVDPTGAHCSDSNFSYMKNRWVAITGPNGQTCYGQIEDAGPDHYDAEAYVFGANDARPPADSQTNSAGLDVSPALNGCLGFKALDGDSDHVSWRFVDDKDVPAGPWTHVVTTSGVQNQP
jgi:hypothetical protein